MTWRSPWWAPWRRRPTRRDTIDAIVSQWHWPREAAEHAVNVWGFYPWERVDAT